MWDFILGIVTGAFLMDAVHTWRQTTKEQNELLEEISKIGE